MDKFIQFVFIAMFAYWLGFFQGGVSMLESTGKSCLLQGSFRLGDMVFRCGK